MQSTLYQQRCSEGEERGEAQGEARGRRKQEAKTIQRVLEARLGVVDLGVRQRVKAETDQRALSQWYQAAILLRRRRQRTPAGRPDPPAPNPTAEPHLRRMGGAKLIGQGRIGHWQGLGRCVTRPVSANPPPQECPMSSNTDFYPRRDAEQVLWLKNFRSKIEAHGKTLGWTPARIKEVAERTDSLVASFEGKARAAATYQAAIAMPRPARGGSSTSCAATSTRSRPASSTATASRPTYRLSPAAATPPPAATPTPPSPPRPRPASSASAFASSATTASTSTPAKAASPSGASSPATPTRPTTTTRAIAGPAPRGHRVPPHRHPQRPRSPAPRRMPPPSPSAGSEP